VERRGGSDGIVIEARDPEFGAELDACPALGLLLGSPEVFLPPVLVRSLFSRYAEGGVEATGEL